MKIKLWMFITYLGMAGLTSLLFERGFLMPSIMGAFVTLWIGAMTIVDAVNEARRNGSS